MTVDYEQRKRELAAYFEKQYGSAVQEEKAGSYLHYSGESFFVVQKGKNGIEKRVEVPRSALPVLKRIGVAELYVGPVGIESKLDV
jgi:hypothetical protein